MTSNQLLAVVWFLGLFGAFAGFQLWQSRQIERDTPPRAGSGDGR